MGPARPAQPTEVAYPRSGGKCSCPPGLGLPKDLHLESRLNVEKLRRRKLRTEQGKEKAESCAVDLRREWKKRGKKEEEVGSRGDVVKKVHSNDHVDKMKRGKEKDV